MPKKTPQAASTATGGVSVGISVITFLVVLHLSTFSSIKLKIQPLSFDVQYTVFTEHVTNVRLLSLHFFFTTAIFNIKKYP